MVCRITAGRCRRCWTRARSAAVSRCSRSGADSSRAAATASWMARLIPTPPTGDMAWAASPRHSSPSVVPAPQPVQPDVEHEHIVHGRDRLDAVGQVRAQRSDSSAKRLDAFGAAAGVGSPGDRVGELVVVLAGQSQQGLAAAERGRNARDFTGLFGISRQPKPPHVEGHPVFPGGEPAGVAQRRGAAVAGQCQVGVDFTGAAGTAVAHTRHSAVGDDEAGRLGARGRRAEGSVPQEKRREAR
jgi:hypothetical protein